MMPEIPEEQDQQMHLVQALADTRVLKKVYCSVCCALPTSDLYHCKMQHITCSKCVLGLSVEASEKKKEIQCVECGNLIFACKISNFLLSKCLLDCVNKANGCLVSVGLSHQHECLHSDYYCSPCGREGFKNDSSLKAHVDDDHLERIPISIGIGKKLSMESTDLILEDRADLFLLSFANGNLSVQHLFGDEPHSYDLLAKLSDLDTDNDCYWEFSGYTTKMARIPVEALKLPSLFDELFAENKPAICVVKIGEKPHPEADPITIRLDGLSPSDQRDYLECIICFSIVQQPVYHCLAGHLTCRQCLHLDKIKGRENAGKCSYCSLEMMKCVVGEHILTNAHFSCFEKECGCGMQVAFDDLVVHARNRPFFCPLCLTGFSELYLLTQHFTLHNQNILQIETNAPTKLMVQEGVTLLREGGGTCYILILEGGRLCVQHLPGGIVRSYNFLFKNKGQTWRFEGETKQVDRRRRVSDECLILPSFTDPNFPVEVTVHISDWVHVL